MNAKNFHLQKIRLRPIHNQRKKIDNTFSDTEKCVADGEMEIDKPELLAIIDMLLRDGFIFVRTIQGGTQYLITIEGLLFDGYERGAELKAIENSRLTNLETNQLNSQRNMVNLTSWIAVASIVTATYYIYLLWQELCWCQFTWQK